MSATVAGGRSSRLPIVLILLLMAIPLLAGGIRLVTLAGGADITPDNGTPPAVIPSTADFSNA